MFDWQLTSGRATLTAAGDVAVAVAAGLVESRSVFASGGAQSSLIGQMIVLNPAGAARPRSRPAPAPPRSRSRPRSRRLRPCSRSAPAPAPAPASRPRPRSGARAPRSGAGAGGPLLRFQPVQYADCEQRARRPELSSHDRHAESGERGPGFPRGVQAVGGADLPR